jgi:hypothetical protein
MDILVEATTSRISETTMIGKTITAPDITIRSAAAAEALPMRAALAVVGTASEAVGIVEASVVVMVAAVAVMAVGAGIAELAVSRETVQPGRGNHA